MLRATAGWAAMLVGQRVLPLAQSCSGRQVTEVMCWPAAVLLVPSGCCGCSLASFLTWLWHVTTTTALLQWHSKVHLPGWPGLTVKITVISHSLVYTTGPVKGWAAVQVRQWPEVYDLCHTFLHVARVRTHTDMRELHVSETCLSQKTHRHARITRISRAILACPCVFWLAQRATKCIKIWYLRPLPRASMSLRHSVNLSPTQVQQPAEAILFCLAACYNENDLQFPTKHKKGQL